jgi:LysM repeat protein
MRWTLAIIFFLLCMISNPHADRVYRLQKGETLFKVSKKYNVPVEALIRANPRLNPNKLSAGTPIHIPEKRDSYQVPEVKKVKTPPEKFTPQYNFINPVKDQIMAPGHFKYWKYIVLHHSGTKTGNAKIFDYYHRNVRGMENGLAYHFVIGNGSNSKDGQIEVGSRWRKQIKGGHLKSEAQNQVAIGICFVGDFDRNRPTQKQIASLLELVMYLRQVTHNPNIKIVLHREINVTPTDCPGRYFPAKAIRDLLNQRK